MKFTFTIVNYDCKHLKYGPQGAYLQNIKWMSLSYIFVKITFLENWHESKQNILNNNYHEDRKEFFQNLQILDYT